MRNLKKILALVLALVMSLSLMATAGASSFSDVDDSNPYSTAIDVLDALKVFIGYEDGSFQPTGELTRAEAAVLVYRIATGDVEGKYVENYTYMANSKFNDLDNGYGWAKGYINYCQNAEIIKGTSATTFSPGLKVTGYQLMVMVLRTLGYDKAGEFSDPITWELESARKCEQLGMLKNIPNTGDFGNAAPRAMTAEILFRGLLQNTVKYSVMTPGGYTMDATTLGYQKFTLEEVTGVVVANEYADIRRDENLKGTDKTAPDGITVLDVNGEEYNIVVTSKLEDLGETRTTYTVENGQRDGHNLTGIALENLEADRIVYDDGEALTTTAFSSTLGNVDKDAQRYLNFGENGGVDKTTIKVTYQAESIIEQRSARTADEAKDDFIEKYHLDKATAGQNVDAEYVNHLGSGVYKVTYTPKTTDLLENKEQVLNTGDGHVYSIVKEYAIGSETPTPRYRVEIEPGYTYTAFDKAMVTSIFARASWTVGGTAAGLIVKGEVFRGTQIATDYSDRNNYDVFEDNCLKLAEEHVNTSIDSNSLGWWLKVIDNDNDGYTDWVFQTRYTVAKVSAVNEETGKLTLDTTDWLTEEHKYIEGWDNKNTGWDAADAVNNKGRNITAIDYDEAGLAVGDVVYYAAIDGKNYAWKCDVVTDRVESINRSARTVTLTNKDLYHESAVHEHSASIDLYSFVANMSGTVGMNLYLDKYGNLAAFSQNISGNFVLLTDGWAQTQKNGTDYAVVTWNSTDKKLEQHDVSEGGNLFVRGTGDNTGDGWSVNSWNRIQYFNPLNCDVVDGKLTNDYVHTMVAYMEENGDTVRLLPVDAVYDVQRLNGREYRMIDMNKTVPTNVLPRGTTNGEIWATTTLNGWPYNAKATPTATDPNPTRVRALNNTTYLFVYQSQDRVSVENGWWQNNNASGLYVHQEDGYANGTAWAKGLDNWIEDVYVVGERAEDVDGVFYTANVVVVELKEGFSPNTHKDLEQAFIYNIPTTIGLNTVEQVDAILGSTGEDADILVDLGDARNYTEAESTNNVILPGLYWLHRTGKTSADGKDIYYVEHMHHDDVAANSYYVGTVRSSDFVYGADYVDINDWYCNTSAKNADGTPTAPNATHHTGENVVGSAHEKTVTGKQNPYQGALGNPVKNVESSKYYNLSYDANNWGTASVGSAGVTLSQWKDWGTVSNKNLNQVLVRYNGAGNIVYAVSFDHLLGNTLNENYAQYVWRTCLKDGYTAPAPGVTPAVVEFFGVTNGHEDDKDQVNNSITVTYEKADSFDKTVNNIVVKGSSITSVTDKNDPTIVFTPNAAKTEWTAKVPVAAGTHTIGIVQDGKYTEWTLTQKAVGTGAILTDVNGTAVAPNVDNTNFTIDQPADWLVTNWINNFTPSAGATAVWTLKHSGKEYKVEWKDGKYDFSTLPDQGMQTNGLEGWNVVVKSEDGQTTNTYYASAVRTAIAAAATAAANIGENNYLKQEYKNINHTGNQSVTCQLNNLPVVQALISEQIEKAYAAKSVAEANAVKTYVEGDMLSDIRKAVVAYMIGDATTEGQADVLLGGRAPSAVFVANPATPAAKNSGYFTTGFSCNNWNVDLADAYDDLRSDLQTATFDNLQSIWNSFADRALAAEQHKIFENNTQVDQGGISGNDASVPTGGLSYADAYAAAGVSYDYSVPGKVTINVTRSVFQNLTNNPGGSKSALLTLVNNGSPTAGNNILWAGVHINVPAEAQGAKRCFSETALTSENVATTLAGESAIARGSGDFLNDGMNTWLKIGNAEWNNSDSKFTSASLAAEQTEYMYVQFYSTTDCQAGTEIGGVMTFVTDVKIP